MIKYNKMLDSLAKEFIARFQQSKTQEDQVRFVKDFLFTLPVKQNVLFDPVLTQQEIMCLLLADTGKTSNESAKCLMIKRSTVESHRKEILRKLSCRSIAQAVYEGIRYGFLSPKQNEWSGHATQGESHE